MTHRWVGGAKKSTRPHTHAVGMAALKPVSRISGLFEFCCTTLVVFYFLLCEAIKGFPLSIKLASNWSKGKVINCTFSSKHLILIEKYLMMMRCGLMFITLDCACGLTDLNPSIPISHPRNTTPGDSTYIVV